MPITAFMIDPDYPTNMSASSATTRDHGIVDDHPCPRISSPQARTTTPGGLLLHSRAARLRPSRWEGGNSWPGPAALPLVRSVRSATRIREPAAPESGSYVSYALRSRARRLISSNHHRGPCARPHLVGEQSEVLTKQPERRQVALVARSTRGA